MNREQDIWQLIQRFVTGNATAEERQALHEWMDLDSVNRQLVREIEKIWDLTPEDDVDVNIQRAWKEFESKVIHKERRKHSTSISRYMQILRVAAVILIAAFAGFLTYKGLNLDFSSDADQMSAHILQLENMITGQGEKASANFSDGTEVILNSASKLRFPQEFRGDRREVHLEGEAYFKVAPDPNHPFIVHIRGTEIEVLGTEFNVRGWSEDTSVDVVVREGKVSVTASIGEADKHPEVILEAGDYTRITDGQGPSPVQKVDTSNYLVWMSGGLYFRDTPFHQVLRDIERRFDVEIILYASDLSDVPFTGKFQYADLEEVLSIIAVSMDIDYRREGSLIELI